MLEIHQNGCSVKLKQCSMATSGQNLNSLNFTKLHHKTFSWQTTSNNGSKCNLCLGSLHILHLAPEFSCHKSAIWSDMRVWGQHDTSKVTRNILVSFPPFKDHIKSDNSGASLPVPSKLSTSVAKDLLFCSLKRHMYQRGFRLISVTINFALLCYITHSWQNAPYQLDNHDQISTTGKIKTRGQRKRHDSYSWPQLLIRCVVSLTPGRWSGHHDDNASLLSSAPTRTVARLSVFCDLSARNILLHGRAKTVMELFQIFITSLFGGGTLYSAWTWTAESQFTGMGRNEKQLGRITR